MPTAASPERQVKGPPEVLRAPIDNGESRPVWISAVKSVSAGKGADESQLDVSLLSEREAGFLQARLDVYRQNRSSYPAELLEADPCAGAPPNQADYHVLQPSVGDLAVHSTAAFSGTVQWAQEGLHRGSAATLYAVTVDKVWKYDEKVRVGDTALFSFPLAQIKVKDAWLCARSLRYPVAPTIGSRALVFSSKRADHPDPIYSPIDQELFFEKGDGTLSVPWHLAGELGAASLSAIERKVTEILGDPEMAR